METMFGRHLRTDFNPFTFTLALLLFSFTGWVTFRYFEKITRAQDRPSTDPKAGHGSLHASSSAALAEPRNPHGRHRHAASDKRADPGAEYEQHGVNFNDSTQKDEIEMQRWDQERG
jgi:hypothetical protein